MPHYDEPLSMDPIPAPRVGKKERGRRINFSEIVKNAGMINVIITNNEIEITTHDLPYDFKVPYPGRVVYCLSEKFLPSGDGKERAREVLRRLAYGFHDWAAREVVARYHRDLMRAARSPEQHMR